MIVITELMNYNELVKSIKIFVE